MLRISGGAVVAVGVAVRPLSAALIVVASKE